MGAGADNQQTVAVKTYVPESQREAWRRQADELDMTLSEFVRSMVQAGRRDFDVEPRNAGSEDATPGGSDLEAEIIEVLASSGPLEWEELLGELIGDFEDELESTLSDLQSENRIQYSGRGGGYTLTDE